MELFKEKSNNQKVNNPPSFLITIDTEGDNLWSRPQTITTENARFLPRFQEICNSYGFKPTYLTNYEMATCPFFIEFGREVLKNGDAEIGMHLHAWNTPPIKPITKNDYVSQPYLIEYSESIMNQKIELMTKLLEDTFGIKIVSHRAGRWGFNEIYARFLVEMGYRVDCSVTPFVSWKHALGDPDQSGGSDYYGFPDRPYFVNLNDISGPGSSSLLEVPTTILRNGQIFMGLCPSLVRNLPIVRKVFNRFFPPLWLRPKTDSTRNLKEILVRALEEKRSYVEFMLHSSELMPGGSPNFPRDEDIEKLYRSLEELFETAKGKFEGSTLKEFYKKFVGAREN